MKKYSVLLIFLVANAITNAQPSTIASYSKDIKNYGQEPIDFINKALSQNDLIVFDDALHSAYEPFVFYTQLINNKSLSEKINFIFLETISATAQPAIDSYLSAQTKDSTILIKAFQDDYTGMGWNFQTYLDLFSTVWAHNQRIPDSLKIKIIGVNPPIYWEAIHSQQDYKLFLNTLQSRDYSMYLEILNNMDGFSKGKKGLFLTNTRHAYKDIRNSKGKLYWNTASFFNQWNPGKVLSVRIHNVTLSIESVKNATERKSADGLNEMVYKWIRMDNGRWDSAFALNGNKPIAIPLKNTKFGNTAYVGNLMLNVAPQTSMYDAYDALIFLAPLTNLHLSAQFNYIYTPQFKPELERRLRLLKENDFEDFLKKNQATTFDEYFKNEFRYVPIAKNTFLKE